GGHDHLPVDTVPVPPRPGDGHGCGWGLPPPLRGRQDAHRGGAVPDHPQPAAGHTLRPVGTGPVRRGPFGDGRGGAMKLTWVKFHLDFFDDPRVKVIETMPESNTMIAIWFK